MNKTQQIFREIERNKTRKLNILTAQTHEGFETNLCGTGHNFYAFCYQGSKPWQTKFRKIPSNYTPLNGNDINQLLPNVQIDLVLSQTKFGQWQILSKVAKYLGVPLINLEHTGSHYGINILDKIQSMKSDRDVFISNWSVDSWGYTQRPHTVIHHGVDSELFTDRKKQRENKILSINNDFINRDYCLNYSQFKRVTEGLPVSIYGDTKGLSEPCSSLEHMIEVYNTHRIFLSTANLSPIPSVVLEAASCGCAIVAARACAVEEYLTDGHDCLLADNDQDMRQHLEFLMSNESKAKELGENARNTIRNKFNLNKFTNNWNDTFWSVMR